METLQYGHMLLDRRQRLQALANWLTSDRARALAVVDRAMIAAWRSREEIDHEAELDPHLRRCFLAAMAETWPTSSAAGGS
jgi:DNA-directed RNA polymerase specialized sigma24 family protein